MTEQLTEQKKATPWKIIIPIAIVLVMCCLCLAVAGVLAYIRSQGGELFSLLPLDAPPLVTEAPVAVTEAPVLSSDSQVLGDWDFYYSWSCSTYNTTPASLTFYPDHTFFYDEYSGGYGTWSVEGDAIDFIFDEGRRVHYIGNFNPAFDYVDGTFVDNTDGTGCWYASRR